MPPHVGYKKCRDGKIVKLRIMGFNNEDRANVKRANAKYAQFRCSEAHVLDIYNPESGEKFTSATSFYDQRFKYTLGQVVKVYDYNSDNSKVWTKGIHYFLNEKAAIGYNMVYGYVTIISRNKRITYYENGTIQSTYTVKNGFNDGEFIKYDLDGEKVISGLFRNGVFIEQTIYSTCGDKTRYVYSGGIVQIEQVN